MLLVACAILVLGLVGVWATAQATRRVMDRLGVDLMAVLLWIGLAEWPVDQPRAERQRLRQLFLEPVSPPAG